MTSFRFAAALAAAALCASGMVFAEGAKLSDQQIAHIAYTAGQLDISAAEQAKERAATRRCAPSPTTWSATTRR